MLDAINLVVNKAKKAIGGTRRKGDLKKCCLMGTYIRYNFNSINWDCIMQALQEKNIRGYLRKVVASYRVLKYDTKNDPREYGITGGVPQGSVLECPSCPKVAEVAKRVFLVCPRFSAQRDKLEKILNQRFQPKTKDLRSIERKRAKDND
ncbi:hypothetical protein EVAR_27908_1 [Eumeta japonica]|uniref:Reverse transcriptase domain-containing protein n=1 Tax=Eumeta variegata TaxID=151549 RepID=A0A4C1UV35_EUMVA|nr:hypothetical protein EVAR_27908_1 [Eumeta japonica]